MKAEFNNRLVVVTGGASGIGEECARRFRGAGARVVIADKNIDRAHHLAEELGAVATALDIAEEESVSAVISHIEERYGPIEALVNCAGVLQRMLPPGKLSMNEWDLVARVDLRGTYLCCALVGVRMAERGRGSVVNIASVAGMRSGPLHAYGPAKAGVISLTESLAAEWGPRGVRVNTVSPGFTKTPALNKGIQNGSLDGGTMACSSALQRLVEPSEVASAAVFLASDLASGITGVNLAVDAGYLVATPWQSYGGLRDNRLN